MQQLLPTQSSKKYGENHIETLCELFVTDTRKRLVRLRVSVDTRNQEYFCKDFHQVIGGCRQLGALRMKRSCKKLQNKFDAGSLENCIHLMNRLDYELFRIERLIEIHKNSSVNELV